MWAPTTVSSLAACDSIAAPSCCSCTSEGMPPWRLCCCGAARLTGRTRATCSLCCASRPLHSTPCRCCSTSLTPCPSTCTSNEASAFVKELVQLSGHNPADYSPHSMRIGAATTMAHRGSTAQDIPQDIQRAGRWSSDAYKIYTRPSIAQQQRISAALTSAAPAALVPQRSSL